MNYTVYHRVWPLTISCHRSLSCQSNICHVMDVIITSKSMSLLSLVINCCYRSLITVALSVKSSKDSAYMLRCQGVFSAHVNTSQHMSLKAIIVCHQSLSLHITVTDMIVTLMHPRLYLSMYASSCILLLLSSKIWTKHVNNTVTYLTEMR